MLNTLDIFSLIIASDLLCRYVYPYLADRVRGDEHIPRSHRKGLSKFCAHSLPVTVLLDTYSVGRCHEHD